MESSPVLLFGFTTFISALAFSVILYTITDIRYRFRLAVTPIPLFRITYFLIILIGFGTLITDLWFVEHWPIPRFLDDQAIWQAAFGVFSVFLVLIWIYYAAIKPPIFRKRNYKKFTRKLYQVILSGSNIELPTIADELGRSAASIIKLTKETPHSCHNPQNNRCDTKKRIPGVEDYAHELLLLIGNRKFCQHIVASSPTTAIAFFDAMRVEKKYNIPIGQFAKNVSTEALANKGSILYHEDKGYKSGLIGYLKPFSRTIYGNYQLVEALATKYGSPLDIDHELARSWDAAQLEAYCRCVMLTWKNYIKVGNWHQHSYALYHAFGTIKNSCQDIYKLDACGEYSTDIHHRLSITVNFFKAAITFLDKQSNVPDAPLKVCKNQQKDFYDYLSNHVVDIVSFASSVESPTDQCWTIQHNTIWKAFFCSYNNDGKAWKIIRQKLRRQLYDEVCQLGEFPNYKSAGVLGFLLNVMGLKTGDKNNRNQLYYALHKATLRWTENNYLKLISIQPDVAKFCLIGSISFDEEKSRLVKTYLKGLNLESPKEYLALFKDNDDK